MIALALTLWTRHRATWLWLLIALMVCAALLKLGFEFPRLVWGADRLDALDYLVRRGEVRGWFAGQPVYAAPLGAHYPPASQVMVWPLVGWPSSSIGRWIWALTALLALATLTAVLVRESGATGHLERLVAGLLLMSMNASGAAIGIGQISLHLLAPLVVGLLLVCRGPVSWRRDLLGATLLLLALIKPTLSGPFFWLVLLVPGRLRPTILVALGYLVLTVFAIQFQAGSLLERLVGWVPGESNPTIDLGYADLYWVLSALGQKAWMLPASLATLAVLGVWVYRHRQADLWLLIGVTAICARLWAYHRVYDDILIVLPMLALFRIAREEKPGSGAALTAAALLAVTILSMLLPGRLLQLPLPWGLLFSLEHAAIWIAVLVFLLDRARRARLAGTAADRYDRAAQGASA